jgi:ABC-2 type transport system permease protein
MLPFSVPMMYPYTLVHKRFESFPLIEHFYLFNPVAEAVLLMQRAFWITTIGPSDLKEAKDNGWGFSPNVHSNFPPHLLERGLICIAFGVLFLAFAQWVFSRLDDKIPDRLIG